MENLVVVWYLLLEATNKSWTIPAPYPTEEICMDVGENNFRWGKSYKKYYCIPAPVFNPDFYGMFKRKE